MHHLPLLQFAIIYLPNIYIRGVKMLTLFHFKHFLTLCRTKDMKIQNINCQNNRLSHMAHRLPLLQFARKNSSSLVGQTNFISNKSLNNRTQHCFKNSLMPCKTRDMKIRNCLLQNQHHTRRIARHC